MNDSWTTYGITYDEIMHEGPTRTLFRIGDRTVWLPYNCIEVYPEESRVEMPEWLMLEEGLEGFSNDYPS